MKRLENLSTLNITTMNNDKNQTSNSTNEKVTRVSSMEEMIAILDGEAIKISENGETKFFYLKENEKVEIAHQIAEMYLQQFPRPKCYGVHLLSSEGGNELTPYYQLTDEEIAVIRNWEKNPVDEDGCEIDFHEYLEEGHGDLMERFLSYDAPFELDIIDSCDLNNPLKFTNFSIQFKNKDGSLNLPQIMGCPLSDEEFVELLACCLLFENRISMNMLVYRKPEIAKHIIEHLTWAYLDNKFECWEPSICDLDELKSITRSILDPSVDILHLIDSDDIRIQAFLKGHKIEKEAEK